MGVYSGPAISTTSMVFSYDMGNEKSYYGAPTVNLASNPNDFTQATWIKSFTTVALSTTELSPVYAGNGDQRTYKLAETAAVNQHMIYQQPAVSSGQVYSLSIFAKAAERSQLMLTMFGEGYSVFDLSTGTIFQTGGNVCSITPVGNGWYLCTATITKTNATAGFFTGIWSGGVSSYLGVTGYGLYISRFQYELKNYPTRYVNGERTASTNIKNIINTSQTVTATGLTYTSGNTFTFNGSTDYITGPSALQFTAGSDFTFEAWANRTASVNNYNMVCGRGLPYLAFLWNDSVRLSTQIAGVQFTVDGTAVSNPNGLYHHIVGTQKYNSGANTTTINVYVDGVVTGTGTTAGAFTDAYSAYTFAIGDWFSVSGTAYRFQGEIPIVNVYNTALSADTVLRNFNSLKGRFGL